MHAEALRQEIVDRSDIDQTVDMGDLVGGLVCGQIHRDPGIRQESIRRELKGQEAVFAFFFLLLAASVFRRGAAAVSLKILLECRDTCEPVF